MPGLGTPDPDSDPDSGSGTEASRRLRPGSRKVKPCDRMAEFGSWNPPVYQGVSGFRDGTNRPLVSARTTLLAPTSAGYHVHHDDAGDGIA
jgi:hypothetical protein